MLGEPHLGLTCLALCIGDMLECVLIKGDGDLLPSGNFKDVGDDIFVVGSSFFGQTYDLCC